MRRVFLMSLVLAAGCQSVVGPLECRRPIRVDDPCVSVGEQKRRGHERLALPDETGMSGPLVMPLPGWGNGR